MSYDLDLFTLQNGVLPITTIQEAALHRDTAQNSLNQRTIKALEAANPNFHAQMSLATIDLIEASGGIKISLYHNGGHISIPYWHSDDEAIRQAFQTARRYLNIIQQETGYAVYDPQLGRLIDVRVDLPPMIATYKRALANMHSIF